MSDKIRQKDKNNISGYIQGGEKKVMTKFNKKMINVLATATLVAGVAAPIAALTAPTAIHASSSYNAITTPTIGTDANNTAQLGLARITVSKASVVSGGSYTFTLPKGFKFVGTNGVGKASSVSDATYGVGVSADLGDNDARTKDGVAIPATITNIKVVALSDNSAKVSFDGNNTSDDVDFYVNFRSVNATGPSNGPVKVAFDAQSGSGLTSGEVTVANVVSSGQVSLAASDTVSKSDNFDFTLKVKEQTAGSLDANNSIKLKLPSGFKWTSSKTVVPLYGDITNANVSVNFTSDDTAEIRVKNRTEVKESQFRLPLSFEVNDESIAKTGDVTVSVSGNATTDVSSLVVGTYGEIGGGVSVAKPTTLLAGKDEQKIGDVAIKETVAGSFVGERTVTLRLPEGARWQTPYEDGKGKTDFNGSLEYTNGLNGVTASYTDSDNRTLKLKFPENSLSKNASDPGTVTLKNFEVAVQPGFSGDLNVEVAGSQGLNGTVKVATVKQNVTLAAASKPNLTIGLGGQQIGDITITEAAKEALVKKDGNSTYATLELPEGVYFAETPDVKVTAGDLRIKSVTTDSYDFGSGYKNRGTLRFYVDSESTAPSTITISSPKLIVDRTVAQGDIVAKLKGDAAAYTAYHGNKDTTQNWKDSNTVAASVAIATVGTPAPGATKTKAVFTLGSTSYTVNGESKTADVAAYAQNGRTYLPVRYAAEALGVSPQNILFDKATSTVTLIKGDRVAQIKLNTNLLTVNGSVIRMDVKAVTNKNRTVLPIFWVSRALDASINYDATAKTVTVENNN
ncbi:copper amine oxidase N-terminal domain-containing protein [Paenibacillus polymyxa]|uniref:copper amine oxidase N-terminal domain-containing protein n=1 Tax=Paenibacillus polymyxa TaxID=1406 RepID=UPI00237A0756|nr:copper amine oxidase N-terminal domain-containing protein [Paenibacillus polymyxa]WDM21661.1 copper amine oxidase N-terminal domain-containing protein [Paenibacillus polymyxa]